MTTARIRQRALRRIRRTGRRGAKAGVQTWRHVLRGQRPGLHAFVVGAQRSGTNMMMNVLDRSFDTTVFHERDTRAFEQYLMREPEVIDGLVRHAHGRVFVIKALCEMDRLPSLMERYQPAVTLWVFRHYEEAVRSSLRSFSTVAGQVSKLVDEPESAGWMGRGMSRDTHARIRDLHHPEMNDASRVALFWYLRNRLLFDLNLMLDERLRLVQYERLLRFPHEEFGALFASLGLDYRRSMGGDVKRQERHGNEPLPIEADVREICDGLHAELMALAERQCGDVNEDRS